MKKLNFSQLQKEFKIITLKFNPGKLWKSPITSRLIAQIELIWAKRKRLSWKSPVVISGILVLLLISGGTVLYLANTVSASYMVINGQKVGLVQTTETGKALIDDILKERGQSIGEIAKTHDQIEYQNIRVKKVVLLEQEITKNSLANKLTSYFDGWELLINDQKIAVLPTQEAAQKMLEDYQDFYTKPSETNKVSTVSFEENVTIKPIEAIATDIESPETLLKSLEEGQTITKEYTVQPNDSWWLIARKNDMKTKEVLDGNPGSTEDTKLQPGQKIKLVSVVPYLTVLSKGTKTTTETIPFSVVTNTDYSLGSGQTVVKQQGNDGSKIVTYSYDEKNGKDVAKSVLDEKIVTPSVTQVVAKGPVRVPVTVGYASRGSGNVSGLGWPLQGTISSYYGYRHGGFHTGLDITGSRGDPYVAAASGTVVSAGWDGGYGYMILIDHGNGVQTRYGHSSKLLVSIGDHVAKGQTIGLVGATGNATGPHLHFEVISNGDTLNPLDYLP